MNIYDEEFVIHVAECTAVLATALEADWIKLGGEGLIAHYCAVAQYGLEVANLFPLLGGARSHKQSVEKNRKAPGH